MNKKSMGPGILFLILAEENPVYDLTVEILIFSKRGLLSFSRCGKYIFPVEPVMCKWRRIELALLKRFEIPEHPLRAEAYAELEPAMINDVDS